MKKRGQLSIFLLFALVFIIAAGILIFFKNENLEKTNMVLSEPNFEPYFFFLENCLKDKAKDSVKEVMLNGGYLKAPEPYVQIIFFSYPFYLVEGKNYLPPRETISSELEKAYNEVSVQCYDDLLYAKNNTMEIKLGKIDSEALITKNSVILRINYPVTIGTENKKESRESYRFEVPAEVDYVYSAIEEFINDEEETPDALCWSCLSDISKKYDLKIDMQVFDEKTVLFSFFQNKTDFPITWMFANEYG